MLVQSMLLISHISFGWWISP